MSDPILDIRAVSRRWRGRPDPVLDDVTLRLEAGEIAWLGGINGAGKTTLLRIVCGLLAPTTGELLVAGRRLEDDRAAYYRNIGFLSAGDRGLVARMTVRQQLTYWCKLAYVPRSAIGVRIEEAAELLGIEPLLMQRVDRLSLGQRQRIRIAMAYLHQPKLLVLDEPRNSLDDAGYASLNRVVTWQAEKGGAVLWCSPRGEDRVVAYDRSFVIENARMREVTQR